MQNVVIVRTLRRAARTAAATALFGAALLLLICALIVLAGRRDELRPPGVGRVGAAIVLGAAHTDGVPGPIFQARLDHALELYRRGQLRLIIVAGGAPAGGPLSEAAAGRRYLLGRGLPAEALLTEEASASTWENLRNSAPVVRANGITTVAIVSDPTHMLRALKMARDLGLECYGSPAPGPADSAGLPAQAGALLGEALKYLAYLFARV